jgi:hypothetical protein
VLAVPLALLRLTPLEILVIGALLIVSLEYSSERFATGWAAFPASPRLFGAWLMWAAGARELRREGRLPNWGSVRASVGVTIPALRRQEWLFHVANLFEGLAQAGQR